MYNNENLTIDWNNLEKLDKLANMLWSYCESVAFSNNSRIQTNFTNARVYSNNYYNSLSLGNYNNNSTYNRHRLSFNVVSNMVDTVAAKLSKVKIKPTFLTDKGDYRLRSKAEKLDRYIQGVFYENNIYELTQKAFLDSLIMDCGILKVLQDDDSISLERVLPTEFLIDSVDGYYSNPSTVIQTKYMHKSVVQSMFDDVDEFLLSTSCKSFGKFDVIYKTSVADYIVVLEIFHRINNKESWHIITTSNQILLQEKWGDKQFPYVIYRYKPNLVGFFSQSLVDTLIPVQVEINTLLRDIQYSRSVYAIPFIALEHGSNIKDSQIDSNIAHIVHYSNTPPQYITPPISDPSWFNYLNLLINKAYEISGISQLSATSLKPVGLESAVSLRTYNDFETERFVLLAQQYEGSFIDLTNLIIEQTKDMFKGRKNKEIKLHYKSFIKNIKWDEVDMEKDKYYLKIFPTSLLPSTPAGKTQMVSEFTDRGYLTPTEAMRLLDFPDLASVVEPKVAAEEYIHCIISDLIDKGIYTSPDTYMDLDYALKYANSALNTIRTTDIEDSKIMLLMQFIDEVHVLLTPEVPPAEPMLPQNTMESMQGMPPIPGAMPPTM